jgi:hypothetical protein
MFGLFWGLGGINEGVFPHYPQKNLEDQRTESRTGRGVQGRGSQEKRQKIGLRG